MSFLLTVLLAVVGVLLLLSSLVGVALGAYMALDDRTRERGIFFAVWWIPAVAAACGIVTHDWVTFIIGTFCFVVAGTALALEHHDLQRPARDGKTGTGDAKRHRSPEVARRWLSEKARRWSSEGAKRLTKISKRTWR